MASLTEITIEQHKNLKVAPDCALGVAQNQHVISLKVTEVAKAATCFPVFFTRSGPTGDCSISSMMGLELNNNLFVKNGKWDAVYKPSGMQTYPFFLMNSPGEKGGYTIGIEEGNPAFSEQEGEPLFDESGNASLLLSQVTILLEEDIKNDLQTFQFTKRLEELDLIKAMDVQVQYDDGRVNTLSGLSTISEEKLQELETADFQDLRERGYLVPIYAFLISIYQLNTLINRHNLVEGSSKVVQVKMEVPKAQNAQ